MIRYVPDGTIMMTHPFDITVTFDEMMRTLGHTPFVIPYRTTDARDYRSLFRGRERAHGFSHGRGSFGGPVGNGEPFIPPCCP